MREEDEGSPWFGFPFDINKKSNGLYELYYDINNAVFALIFARNKKTGEVSSFLFFDSK